MKVAVEGEGEEEGVSFHLVCCQNYSQGRHVEVVAADDDADEDSFAHHQNWHAVADDCDAVQEDMTTCIVAVDIDVVDDDHFHHYFCGHRHHRCRPYGNAVFATLNVDCPLYMLLTRINA